MSSQSSWRPNVPESQLFSEKTWLQGGILSAVPYGVNLALFTLILPLLITRLKVDIKHNGRPSRQMACLLAYVCVMFILSTLAVASQAEMTQLSFIDNRDFPGGPAAYQELMFSIPISNLGNYCVCLMSWFSDSLLLWRCSVIYRGSRPSIWFVMTIPGLMLLVIFVAGIIFLDSISRPSSSPWAKTTVTSNLIFLITSLSLNIILTSMIVIRVYRHRRRLKKALGGHQATNYTTIISILIESAAILVVFGLWSIITLAMGTQVGNIPLCSMVQVQGAASYMIIFRVAKGTAWTTGTADSGGHSTVRFHTVLVEQPADSLSVTSKYRNQFPLDGSRYALDTEMTSRGTVYESSPANSADVIEKARSNAD